MQHVLVTGGSGFIGRHLVAALVSAGIRVKCLVRPTSRVEHLRSRRVKLVYGDVTNVGPWQSELHDVDVVFHVAGLTHAITKRDLDRTNGIVCGALADACLAAAAPPRLIYISSLSAAGPTPKGVAEINEGVAPRPISNYGRSKRRGEIEIQKRAADLPATILRPGIVFGPHDPATVLVFRPIYRYRLHFVVGMRTPPLSLIFVDDLVRLLLQAADQGERLVGAPDGAYSPQGYYFACDDSEHPTYGQLGQRVAKALNRKVLVWPLWRWVGRTIGGASQFSDRLRGRSAILNVDKIREASASSWACSCQKARQDLGFAPRDDLDVALKNTAIWYLQNQWL